MSEVALQENGSPNREESIFALGRKTPKEQKHFNYRRLLTFDSVA